MVKVLKIALAFFLAATASAISEEYPSRIIKIVVPYPTGQTTDIMARRIAQDMEEALGASSFVENREGAGGTLGMQYGKHADPDGYTVLFTASGPVGINPSLYRELPYDVLNDFAPVGLIGVVPQFLITAPDFPADTLDELIEVVRSNPGEYNYGSGGIGLTNHLTMEMFTHAAELEMPHVPYRGAAQASQGLLGGEVTMMFESGPVVIPQLSDGRIKVFATGSANGSQALPDVPSVVDAQGIDKFDAASWAVVMVPTGTPDAIVDKLHGALAYSLDKSDTREFLGGLGVDVSLMSPSDTRDFIEEEIERWGTVIRDAGIPLN